MRRQEIVAKINDRQSFLCVGLDSDPKKIPLFFQDFADPVFEFNRRVINATRDYCVAYKPNIAFYEAAGVKGWQSLEKTLAYIPESHFTIADAKRGDIGNTSGLYARTFFETYPFDAVTVAPYMGYDSIQPFLEYEDKWVVLLGLTSNIGSEDFQLLATREGKLLYQQVIETSMKWADENQMMYVVGATQATSFQQIRTLVPDHFLLVPGIGTQGGDLQAVFKYGANKDIGLLVNASRSIIFAGTEEATFDEAVEEAAAKLQREMKLLMV